MYPVAITDEGAQDRGGIARDNKEVHEFCGFVLAQPEMLHQVKRKDCLHSIEGESLAKFVPYQILDTPRKRREVAL